MNSVIRSWRSWIRYTSRIDKSETLLNRKMKVNS